MRSETVQSRPSGVKDVLNGRIKHREWFRLFAPSIADYQRAYFEHDHASPFMLQIYKIRPVRSERLHVP